MSEVAGRKKQLFFSLQLFFLVSFKSLYSSQLMSLKYISEEEEEEKEEEEEDEKRKRSSEKDYSLALSLSPTHRGNRVACFCA